MTNTHNPPNGAQRQSLDALRKWQALQYGMFIHFGMSTFVDNELPSGNDPSITYAPTNLNVDQWIQVARDAGMKYVVLTAKHVSGHCLWPSALTDYDIETSSNKTDVVDAFVKACHKHGVQPGLYYCSWDNHHRMGSKTPSDIPFGEATTTQKYRDFQLGQIEELLQHYGPLLEVWIDIPGVLGPDGRRIQYDQIARLQPDAMIMLNSGFGDGSSIKWDYAWPSDLMAIERWLPSSNRGYNPWFKIPKQYQLASESPATQSRDTQPSQDDGSKDYYIPGEVCDPIGYEWFNMPHDPPRSDRELLGMRLICQARKVNFLLDVPPDRSGQIPKERVDALMRLAKNFENAPR